MTSIGVSRVVYITALTALVAAASAEPALADRRFPPAGYPPTPVECAGFAGDAPLAAAFAAECDREVEVLGARSEWASTFALPDGSMRLDTSIAAVRTDVSGEWEPVDPSVVAGDGALRVASAVTPTSRSATS